MLIAVHPSSIATSLVEGNIEISEGLEWIRTWALHVADSDPDRECYTVSKEFLPHFSVSYLLCLGFKRYLSDLCLFKNA